MATLGRAGDFDYETGGSGYAGQRRADPRIAAQIHAALGAARVVLNVGAGAGSYEPEDRRVLAVEPSAAMRAQRPTRLARAIAAVAAELPLAEGSVDASMALVTVHQWPDAARGLAELRRVTRGAIVIMTFDGDALDRFWLAEYAPELIAAERRRYPALATIRAALGGETVVENVPIPIDCSDGFTEAYYARPERFLDPAVRAAQSAWGFVTKDEQARAVHKLAGELASGAWDERHGRWRNAPSFDGSLRLVIRRG